jgi:hypothetical protein
MISLRLSLHLVLRGFRSLSLVLSRRRLPLALSLCRSLFLVLVVFMTGNTTTKRTQNPMMRHMAGHCTRDAATNAANRICLAVAANANSRSCQKYN